LREIKAKHGNPYWFVDPQINYLHKVDHECKIKESEEFIIEFVCPVGYEVQSLKEELDTLKSLVNVKVRIRNGYGLGSQLESIKNLIQCMEDG